MCLNNHHVDEHGNDLPCNNPNVPTQVVIVEPTFTNPYNCGICDTVGEEQLMHWCRHVPDTDTMVRVCKPCETIQTSYCCHCNRRFHNSYTTNFNDSVYCNQCYENNFISCVHCSNTIHIDDTYNLRFRSGRSCGSCFETHHLSCESCSVEIHEGETYCDNCNPVGRINQYTFKPSPQYFKTIETDKFFGIEVEVESCGSQTSTLSMARKIVMPETYFKRDGSLNDGFEIVSHPMSYEYIKENRNLFDEKMFKPLKENGYKSYETQTCGIHIHISRKAFGTWHLYRFMKFFSENQVFILKMSQRLKEKLDEWASLDEPSKSKLLRKIKNSREQEGRYMAINLQNKNTIEVRIFRGTLNINSFFKNIQFLESLYWFTKNNSAEKVTLPLFLEYVEANKGEYKDLHKFINSNNYKSNKLPRKGDK